jgi:hypothetical protein
MKQPNLRQLRQRLVLQAKTHALSLEEARSYIAERLRIAGGNGKPIFSPEAVTAIHRYSNGIPRVVNLICEHCLVSAFVDEQKMVSASVVDAIARDFELREDDLTPDPELDSPERIDLMDALKTLSNLAGQLREAEAEQTAKVGKHSSSEKPKN